MTAHYIAKYLVPARIEQGRSERCSLGMRLVNRVIEGESDKDVLSKAREYESRTRDAMDDPRVQLFRLMQTQDTFPYVFVRDIQLVS